MKKRTVSHLSGLVIGENLTDAERQSIPVDVFWKAAESAGKNFLWNGLGNLLKNHLGRFEEAENAYRRAIELDPDSAYPWNGLAWALYKAGKADDGAEAASRKAVELEPNPSRTHFGAAANRVVPRFVPVGNLRQAARGWY